MPLPAPVTIATRSASIMITLLACRGPEDTVSSLILKSLLFGRPWWVNQRSPRQGDATVRDSDGPYVGGRKTQGAEEDGYCNDRSDGRERGLACPQLGGSVMIDVEKIDALF